MKRMIVVSMLGGMALLTGCMTEQMKSTPFYEGNDVTYTGRPEDRVNLWPLAYWREPVGSVLWPLISFSDDQFAVRPLYSRYGDEHNFLWPLGQYDSKREKGRLFPFFWGRHYFNVFPVVWNDNKRVNAKGGNDIWQSGVVRPDLVLRDLAGILHPIEDNNNVIYYKPII